jgi:hypothetical protein
MRKIFTTSIVFICLALFSIPYYAFSQDTKSNNNDNDETEEESNMEADSASNQCCCRHIAFGVELGLNVADLLYSQSGGGITSKPIVMGRAGVLVDIPLCGSFFLQPGVFYAMNGGKVDNNTTNLNTIEVPVNVMYKFHLKTCNSLFVGIGPYVGYNISGTQTNGSLKIGSDNTDNIKAFDFGAGINVGYEMCNGLFFRARYQWGIANLQPQNDYITNINSESYGVQIGYFFGRKPAKCMKDSQPKGKDLPNAWDE